MKPCSKPFKFAILTLLGLLGVLVAMGAAGAVLRHETRAAWAVAGLGLPILAAAWWAARRPVAQSRPKPSRVRQRAGFSGRLFVRAFVLRLPVAVALGYALARAAAFGVQLPGGPDAVSFGAWVGVVVVEVFFVLRTLKLARAAFDPFVDVRVLRGRAARKTAGRRLPTAAAAAGAVGGAAFAEDALRQEESTSEKSSWLLSSDSSEYAGDDSDLFSSDLRPAVNLDGSAMVGDLDIHGNAYGFTENSFSSSSDAFEGDLFS